MKVDHIHRTGMIGSGTMGAGFGLSFALAGIEAVLYDIEPGQLELGLARIDKALGLMIAEGLVEGRESDRILSRITATTDLGEAVAGSQFLLEAVPEVLELKKELFPRMEELGAPGTILASNTSALSITRIGSACRSPELVCGMHWFNPPELVPLVEVIPGEMTAPETAKAVFDLILKLDHVPIMVKKEAPGFVGNRLQLALFREAMHILEEGIAGPEEIDQAVKHSLGLRWSLLGPMRIADLGGLDTWGYVAEYLFPFLSNTPDPPQALTDLVGQGKLGVKTGQGFYTYSQDAGDEAVRQRDLYFLRQRRLVEDIEKT